MATYTTKRKYTKKSSTSKKTTSKKAVVSAPVVEEVKLSVWQKALNWLKAL